MSVLYITTMSSTDKVNPSLKMNKTKKVRILEAPDYGSEKLNNFYMKLHKSVKEKIKAYNTEEAIQILELMSNTNIQQVYDGLTSTEKLKLQKMNIIEKYTTLKKMLDQKIQDTTFVLEQKTSEMIPTANPDVETFNRMGLDEDLKREREREQEREQDQGREQDQEQVIDEEEEDGDKHREKPQQSFEKLVKTYYDNNRRGELEVKFGTKGTNITKNNYDNVVKKFKSCGFTAIGEENGEYYLRVNSEFLDSVTGRFKMSNIRTDIQTLPNIQDYCKNNDIKHLPHDLFVEHLSKGPMFIDGKKIFPVDFSDFNFRATYSSENAAKLGVVNNLVENWRKSKKEFRLINRVSFEHPDYPFRLDLSIVKYGNRMPDKFGRKNRGPIIRVYTMEESNILNNEEVYEIELEIDNKKVGPGTRFNSPQAILDSLRKGIKFVLSGIQNTNYPISYLEQKNVIESYMKLIWKDAYDPKRYVSSKYFIGPNSYTLQMENIAATNENSTQPNIRKDFVVTDKADGQRHLLYINSFGKIYLINSNMDVIFTGARTDNKECVNTLIDGELITHDKYGKFMNLYAAFDIYFIKSEDVRAFSFMMREGEKDLFKSRNNLLHFVRNTLNAVAITSTGKSSKKMQPSEFATKDNLLCPLRFCVKEFFPSQPRESIFEGCRQVLQKEDNGRFEYNTDGLIFTHAFYGVGSSEVGRAGPKEKTTWEYSFKWKPPQYNTIDFLVTTVKGPNNDDVIKTLFEDGQNNRGVVQLNEYKQIVLRCGFNEKRDGFINPCQDIIDDNLPQYQVRYEDRQENDYIPQQFYPTDPYDVNAGLCNVILRADTSGGKKMFSEENQVFEDNTIVEFRYDFEREEGWRWIPLRVRYDKTARLKKGEREYGNAYHVCNSNWKSIHPTGRIDANMLSTGMNIPDITVNEDKYYNTPSGKFKTGAMKQFHNLYVKKHLIVGVAKQDDILIDLACGKAGDLPKWINARLSFVLGVDLSEDNLENRLDGACARYLKARRVNKRMPYALFVNGNSAYNIKDGSAMLSDKAKQVTAAVFGKGTKDPSKIGQGVARQYAKGADGFHISSCQFAIHYFFENPDILKGFMKNIAECTKHNGYFIGTAYDGKMVFNYLKKLKTDESIKIIEDEKTVWEITKKYKGDTFDDDSSSIGYMINVFQESINQTIPEYLVNFDYLNRVMSAYGFEVISREEAQEFGLPEGTGLFSELFLQMLDEISRNKYKAKDYGEAPMMSANEKQISFLNRYFVYKKVRVVNTEAVELELGEYQETEDIRNTETKHAIEIAEKEILNKKPRVRKLSKKLLLIAATEAIDDTAPEKTEQLSKVLKAKTKKTVKKQPKTQDKPQGKTEGKTEGKPQDQNEDQPKITIIDASSDEED